MVSATLVSVASYQWIVHWGMLIETSEGGPVAVDLDVLTYAEAQMLLKRRLGAAPATAEPEAVAELVRF
nr:hypothetical protein GCM10017745_37400 [Saccharothrix mutabilis subsp. capreolus]